MLLWFGPNISQFVPHTMRGARDAICTNNCVKACQVEEICRAAIALKHEENRVSLHG
jgi:hypothetical protein